jgi:hypothetical protein
MPDYPDLRGSEEPELEPTEEHLRRYAEADERFRKEAELAKKEGEALPPFPEELWSTEDA